MTFKSDLSVTFHDNETAELSWDLVYVHPTLGQIIVKAGFITDFASVPGYVLLPGIVPKVGRIRKAAVIHDWIYRGQEGGRFTRQQADQILYDAAVDCGMPHWRATVAWIGVRVGGWIPWSKARKVLTV